MTTTTIDIPTAIDELKALKQWVGSKTKNPHSPLDGSAGVQVKPETWGTYQQALQAKSRYGWSRIGIALDPKTGIMLIDLDECVTSGVIDAWAQGIMNRLNSYSEFSDGKEGIHILCKAALPDNIGAYVPPKTNGLNIPPKPHVPELYDHDRWSIVTFNHVPGTPLTIENRQREVLALHKETRAKIETHKDLIERASEQRNIIISQNGHSADYGSLVEKVRGAYNFELMVKFAQSHFGQDTEKADHGGLRILGNGGLIIYPTTPPHWKNYSNHIGGDVFNLAAYTHLGKHKVDGKQFHEVLKFAGQYAGVDVEGELAEMRNQASQPSQQAIVNNPHKSLLDGGPTDEANAQALVKLYPNKFLNCVQLAKNGQPGWLFYNGKYWTAEQAPEILDRHIVNMLITRCKAAMDEGTDPNTGKFVEEALVKFCTPNANRIQSCKMNLKSIIRASISDFDNDKDLLNCKNGVVDLRTGALLPHHPGQRFTYCLDVDYKPDADYSFWFTWLRDTVGGDLDTVHYLQQAVGYSLTGQTSEECLFYVHGPTRSGKGTYSETLLKLQGEPLSAGVDFATFTEKRDGDSQNFDLAGLKATRFLVASESNKYQFLNPRRIKAITGGDAIRCAHKHGPFFSYFPQFKIWLFSNEPVRGDSEDDALWARVNVISFPNSHLGTEDKALKRKMLEPANLEGVLAWAVAGAMAWYASPDGLQKPKKVISVTQQQRDKNDFSQQFIDECLTATPGQFLPNPVLKAVYAGWCEAHSLTPKEGKVKLAIGKLYTGNRRYVDLKYLEDTQYNRVITLPPNYGMQQFRGYDGLMITEDALNEYL